jgi:hypothetical protein
VSEVEEGTLDAVEEAVEVQETAVGRSVTPEILQKPCAYVVAASWSASSQEEARQQAIPLKKPLLSQMHLASIPLHPPMLLPEVNCVTQAVFAAVSMTSEPEGKCMNTL